MSGLRVLVLCCIVFVVLCAILMSVSLNRFVIVLTFELWCVKVAHFLPFPSFSVVFGSCCFFCIRVFSLVIRFRGYWLLLAILRIVCHSLFLLLVVSGSVSILFTM